MPCLLLLWTTGRISPLHEATRNAVEKEVQAAIDKGLTLEQTIESVQMPEFAGYALFGCVHPSLNVPAAYKDLSSK